jgi:hypothetical protein
MNLLILNKQFLKKLIKNIKSKLILILILPYVWKWYQQGGGQESIGDGLLIEGRLAKREFEAIWMIEQLINSSYVNYQIRLTALSIFTLESFLYPLIQTTLRTNDTSKMSSLGPFLRLLGDCRTFSSEIDRLLFAGIVYFSSNHDATSIKIQLRNYLNSQDQFVKVDTFISATKIRSIAEQVADATCLFIVHIKHRRNVNAIDISSLSRRPQEQEVLILPNVPFHVEKIECLTNNLQRYIVYLTVEN